MPSSKQDDIFMNRLARLLVAQSKNLNNVDGQQLEVKSKEGNEYGDTGSIVIEHISARTASPES